MTSAKTETGRKEWISSLPRDMKLNIVRKIYKDEIKHPALRTFKRRNLPLSWIVMKLEHFVNEAGYYIYKQGDDISEFYIV